MVTIMANTDIEHKWEHHKTQTKTSTEKDSHGNYMAQFYRMDVYYCKNTCECKEIEQKETVSLPFGGIRNPEKYAPIWYAGEQLLSENEPNSEWVYQETQKKITTERDWQGNYTAGFHQADVYYSTKTCEIKKIEQEETVSLPFGGIRNPEKYAPTWYAEEQLLPENELEDDFTDAINSLNTAKDLSM